MDTRGSEENNPAFKETVDRHHGRLLRAARKILNHDDDAEEIVQETLAEVWKRMNDVPPRNLERYLFRAVRLNALKRLARRRRHCSLEEISDPADCSGAADDWSEEIDPFTLEEALAGLPETQQAALRMKYYMDLTFREIGQVLAISANTAASRCRYGLENLRKVLMKHQGGK